MTTTFPIYTLAHARPCGERTSERVHTHVRVYRFEPVRLLYYYLATDSVGDDEHPLLLSLSLLLLLLSVYFILLFFTHDANTCTIDTFRLNRLCVCVFTCRRCVVGRQRSRHRILYG
jgi:hypothetical protein